jgi:hypothetical protein
LTVRRWLFIFLVVLLLLGYAYEAVTVLPQWIVSLTAGKADANTQLNAVTSTRGALLGILTPLVIFIGGIVGLLNFQEFRAQNVLTNDRATTERDETRRMRRAEVYADMISACNAALDASLDRYYGDVQDAATQLLYLETLGKTRAAMDLAHDRVRLLGSDSVQASAQELNRHLGAEIVTKSNAKPKLSAADWKRISVVEYAPIYKAFVEAARADLAPTR